MMTFLGAERTRKSEEARKRIPSMIRWIIRMIRPPFPHSCKRAHDWDPMYPGAGPSTSARRTASTVCTCAAPAPCSISWRWCATTSTTTTALWPSTTTTSTEPSGRSIRQPPAAPKRCRDVNGLAQRARSRSAYVFINNSNSTANTQGSCRVGKTVDLAMQMPVQSRLSLDPVKPC